MSRQREQAHPGGATLAARRLIDMGPRRKQYQTDAHGKRTAVVLPVAEYERLIEDLQDLAVVAERRDEATLDEEDLKRRLAEGGAV